MAELWDQELYISYNLTFNKSRWAPRDRRDGSEGLKLKMTLKVFVEQLFHSWVVASIGDLKLLALLGVLVLKSFFLPMNITLSLLKLGFINPSWPEPSLSDDLKKVKLATPSQIFDKFTQILHAIISIQSYTVGYLMIHLKYFTSVRFIRIQSSMSGISGKAICFTFLPLNKDWQYN